MERLLDEIVTDILVRLPVKSVMNCRCVSKSWLQLTHLPFFIKSHLNRTLLLQEPHSNFIISSLSIADSSHCTSLFNLEYDETLHDYTCNVVGFSESQTNYPGVRVMGSCNGLICLVGFDDHHGRIYVSNPYTRYCVKLPDPFDYSCDTAVGFGFIPEKNQYKVVTIRNINDKSGSNQAVIFAYTLGDVSWRFLDIIQRKVNWEIFPKQVFVNGALHWWSHSSKTVVIAFNIAHEVVCFIRPPKVHFRDHPSLGVLDGCLSLTGFSLLVSHAEIWVMKKYGVDKSWNKCYSVDFTSIGCINRGLIRTICLQKDGELLMLYHLGILVSYNVNTMKLRMITLGSGEVQLPVKFEVIAHVPTLVSPLDCHEDSGLDQSQI